MSRLYATKRDLKDSFEKHYHLYCTLKPDTYQLSRRLILFYVIETGLKYFLLNMIRKNNTQELQSHRGYEYLQDHGHDIKKMLKSADIEGQFVLKDLKSDNDQPIKPEQYHQAWRYGIKFKNPDKEAEAEKKLKELAEWLEKQI
jgi:hypothetical protein